MLEKILVPIDSIEWDNTLHGIENAMELSKGWSTEGKEPELILLHVFHTNPKISRSEMERVQETEKKRIEEEFEVVKEMCDNKGLCRFKTILKQGPAAEEIVKTAEEEDVGLIVMGSGKLQDRSASGKIHKFFYGSVTEEVLHEAPCSVLVARPID